MDVLFRDLEDGIQLDLALGRLDLAEARRLLQREDTTGARCRVAEARARVDGLLDMWNELTPAPARAAPTT